MGLSPTTTPVPLRDTLFVAGAWRTPHGTDTYEVVSPATGQPLARIPLADAVDVDAAVTAARAAFDGSGWKELTPAERAAGLRRLADALDARADAIAHSVTSQNGSPISLSIPANGYAPGAVARYYAALGEEYGAEQLRTRTGRRTIVRREPVGVAALIVPWNYPQALAMFKLAPALMAGCAVVLKPSPETSLDMALLAEAVVEAGLPSGLVNIVTGGVETGQALVSHSRVDKVAFTGSTAAGRQIAATCGALLRPVSLELGGKSAAVLLDDAPLETFLQAVVGVCLPNTGQTCHASTRLLVPRQRFDEVVDAVAGLLRELLVGDPEDPATVFGPLVTARQRERVEGLIATGVRDGGRVVTGGRRPKELDGFYLEPTLVVDVDPHAVLAQEEVFGPVLVAIPHDGDDDAVRIANDSDYGLGGSVWTADEERGLDVARRVSTGTIGVNFYDLDLDAPFGGRKLSGIGSELGPEGLAAFQLPKSIYLPGAPS